MHFSLVYRLSVSYAFQAISPLSEQSRNHHVGDLHSRFPPLDQAESGNRKRCNQSESSEFAKAALIPSTSSLRHFNDSWNRLFKYDHLHMSPSSRSASFRHLLISLYIDLASSGGTAFPIWRRALVLESAEKLCDIGNVCKLANSLSV